MNPNNLTYATPESQGVPSAAVDKLLETLCKKRLCMHSFILLRHGKVIAEGYWPLFDENRKHRMYSISKSFTAIAIGMMIDEGKLTLDTKAADIFPEYLPANPHPYTLETTVRHLLMMATCNRDNAYTHKSPNFTEAFFTYQGPKHKPGQVFSYDTAATTVLGAMVEKLSGKTMLEYMRPVLDEIGFSKDAWCIETPEGTSWTGSGIICTSRDLARFALLCANGGMWNGKQLLNREYVLEATSRQIDNSISSQSTEAQHGYGYQIWMMQDGGFAFYGMGGQYALCKPDEGLILITNGDTQGRQSAAEIIYTAYYRLLESLSATPLPENPEAHMNLQKRIEGLTLPTPVGGSNSPIAGKINGRKYILQENNPGIKWLKLIAEDDRYRMVFENANGLQEFVFGLCEYKPFIFAEKYYGKRIGIKDKNYQCHGAAAWADDKTLLVNIYAIDDHFGNVHFQLTFDGDEICGLFSKAAEWFFDEYTGFIVGRAD